MKTVTPTLRHLETFRLVMATRSVTETARLMRVSQPAISQSLKALEQAWDLELFVRYGSRIAPTGEARSLLSHVDRVLAQLSQLESVAGELKDSRAGSLAIVAPPTLTTWLIPRAVASFRDERPRVRFRIEACQTPQEVRAVRQEHADLGLTFAPLSDSSVAAEPLMETEIVGYLPPGHALANQPLLRIDHLSDATLIVLSINNLPGLHVREYLRKEKLGALDLIEVNTAAAALALVREGVGIALLDVLAMYSGEAVGLPVRPFQPAIPLVLTAIYSRHRPPSRVTVRFMPHLQRVLDQVCAQVSAKDLPVRRL